MSNALTHIKTFEIVKLPLLTSKLDRELAHTVEKWYFEDNLPLIACYNKLIETYGDV